MLSSLGEVFSAKLGPGAAILLGKNRKVSEVTLSTHVQNVCAQSHRKQDSLVLIVEFQNVKCSVTAAKNALVPWQRDWLSVLLEDRERGYIESFQAHGQLACKFIGTKESVYIRTRFSSQRTGLRHQNHVKTLYISLASTIKATWFRKVHLYMRE